MESVFVLYGVDIIGGRRGGFKIQCGALSKGGGDFKKKQRHEGGLEKNTSTKEGVPRKKCKMVRFPSLPPGHK